MGLLVSPDRLIQIRKNRLLSLNESRESAYVDTEKVREETVQARRLFEKHGWPVIDVTRRSVEETAAAVINLMAQRHAEPQRGPFDPAAPGADAAGVAEGGVAVAEPQA